MPTPGADTFAAELLECSGPGLAGYAATLLLERVPAIRERFAPDAFAAWKTHLTQRTLELAAALRVGDTRLFVNRVLWTAKAFRARGQEKRDIVASLECLRDILNERLPGPARPMPVAGIEQALSALASPPAPEPATLDPVRSRDRIALLYLQKILEGDTAGAIHDVVEATRTGLDTRAAYLEVLLPAQREIGRLWHLGEVTVAEEHLVTATTQRVMSILANAALPAKSRGRTAVIAAVTSNAHDVGLRAVADLFQLDGWRSIFLGADVPAEDLPPVLDYFEADLLLLGATMSTHLPRVEQTIADIRSRSGRPVKIIVGGAAFDEAARLWSLIGADGYAATVDEAVSLGARLTGSV